MIGTAGQHSDHHRAAKTSAEQFFITLLGSKHPYRRRLHGDLNGSSGRAVARLPIRKPWYVVTRD